MLLFDATATTAAAARGGAGVRGLGCRRHGSSNVSFAESL